MFRFLIRFSVLIIIILSFIFGYQKGKQNKMINYSSINNLSLYCQADAGASNWALAVSQYRYKNKGGFPLSLAEVITEITPINPKTQKNLIMDPWGNQYQYQFDSKTGNYAVWSCGSNRINQSALSRIAGDDVGVIVTQY